MTDLELLEEAHNIIANVGNGGDWSTQKPEWVDAATRFRDRYHARIGVHVKALDRGAQPALIKSDRPSIHDLVIEDLDPPLDGQRDDLKEMLTARRVLGLERYGMLLQACNGRDALVDAAEEAVDLVVYLRQLIQERLELGGKPWPWLLQRYKQALDVADELAFQIGERALLSVTVDAAS